MDYYRVILDRRPFGEAPMAEAAPPPPMNPNESFARTLRLCALIEDPVRGLRVGLIDSSTNADFFLSVGETFEGIELVSVSYEEEEAVLRRGAEMAVVKLQDGAIQPVAPAEQAARMQRAGELRTSYAERRRQREAERQRPPAPPPEPVLVGEELEKHLREYQMEVIRQGLPPLPIPLTPEMDNQLVSEGVLPPNP